MTKSFYLVFLVLVQFILHIDADAQKKDRFISQFDSRFTISLKSYYSSLGESEEFFFYLKNNTNQEYKMVINVKLDIACEDKEPFKLGFNRIVYLQPNGEFSPKDDYFHYASNIKKDCRLKDGDSYTVFKGVKYTVTDIQNITEKKEQEANEKKLAEANRQKKIEENKKIAEANKQKKLEEEKKMATEKRMTEDQKLAANKKKADDQKIVEDKKKGITSSSTDGSASLPTTAKSSNSKSSDLATQKATAEENRREQMAKSKAEEEQKIKDEQDRLNQKQTEYNDWKSAAQKSKNESDAASVTALGTVMLVLGGWIYNDKMGVFDPAFSYKTTKKTAQLGVGIDFGYSLTSSPLLFASNKSTVVGGINMNKKQLIANNPIFLNFETTAKIGAEQRYYGGFVYLTPKVGVSPTFSGSFFSLQYGIRAFAGVSMVKAFVDYGSGFRNLNNTSSDVEEKGEGKLNVKFSKLQYGLRFTTTPNSDLKRSHIYLSIINETLSFEKGSLFVNSETGKLSSLSKTPSITGYSLEWNKEHTFKLYANIYPSFIYSGEVAANSGSLSNSFSSTKTGTFIEFGFLRSVNWW
ncbi:MAG: hypothetical protein EAZ13_07555 [Sphingobacteriia bacterium]|nr:MAG: hypothetical protein EAZ13_07555 [Sphingobacteriia bacterium]